MCLTISDYKIKEKIDEVSREEIVTYQKQQERKIPTLVRKISLKIKRLPSFRQSSRITKYSWASLWDYFDKHLRTIRRETVRWPFKVTYTCPYTPTLFFVFDNKDKRWQPWFLEDLSFGHYRHVIGRVIVQRTALNAKAHVRNKRYYQKMDACDGCQISNECSRWKCGL